MRVKTWFARHDPYYAALRRAARTAVVMPLLFAFASVVIGDDDVATFSAFGSFAMLMLVDFGGPLRDRIQAQLGLAVVGAAFVTIGTLVSHPVWLAVACMAIVAFVVLFAGTVSSVLASASTSLLLAFILPVTLPGTVASIGPRLLGWGMAAAVAVVAVAVLWPAPAREPLRVAAAAACRALAGRLRADDARDDDAVASLQSTFLASPSRPTGLSTPARTVVRLVDELNWLNATMTQAELASPVDVSPSSPVGDAAHGVHAAAASVLDEGSALLLQSGGDPVPLETAVLRLAEARAALDAAAMSARLISALEPGFRAQELSHAVDQVARNIVLTAKAERRTWWQRVLGRQPGDVPGPLAAALQRATGYFEWHSVWLRNSIRGAVALGLAVLLADATGVEHSFWVVLGTLSVLRSNALSTGQTALRGVLGTAVGVLVGALLLAVIGTDTIALWILLPFAILLAGVAPAAISFAAGQAAFTVTLVLLFNIIAPTGWSVGLLRIEDIALGCAVSLAVGVLFWPRGAAAALRRALAEAYGDGIGYLTAAVAYGLDRCDPATGTDSPPTAASLRAAAASRRLDDAYRTYVVERGSKLRPIAQVTGSVTGVAGVRLASDAIVDLWRRQDPLTGEVADARNALETLAGRLDLWYRELGRDLLGRAPRPEPLEPDAATEQRLADAAARDLTDGSTAGAAAAIRLIWTADYLDVVRRLQTIIAAPAPAPHGEATAASGAPTG